MTKLTTPVVCECGFSTMDIGIAIDHAMECEEAILILDKTQTKREHTPWYIRKRIGNQDMGEICEIGSDKELVCTAYGGDITTQILREHNSHEALVEACQWVLLLGLQGDVAERIRAALKEEE